MNCQHAQHEMARLQAEPIVRADDPAWDRLVDHLEACSACDRMWSGWDELDDRIAVAMADIPVPLDARARLLQQLQAQSAQVDTNVTAGSTAQVEDDSESADLQVAVIADRPVGVSRRHFGWALISAASVALVACIAWQWMTPETPTDAPWDLSVVRQHLPLNAETVDELSAFDESFAFELPQVGWQRLPVSREIRGWSANRGDPHQVAVVQFEIPGAGSHQPVRGILAAIPADSLAELPSERFFDPSTVGYTTRAGEHYATVAWVEEDLVYVCFVPDGEGSLEQLEAVLQQGTV